MKNLFQNKTLWLTLAILFVVAGGIFAISYFGANHTAGTPTNTQTITEQTTTTVPEPFTEPESLTEPEKTLTAPETTIPVQPPVVQPPNISELLRDVALSAAIDTGYGIATNSEFLLAGLEELEDLTAITLERYITIEPDYDFKLMKNDEGQFILSFDEELPQNEVLNIKLIDENGNPIKSWAFQTETDLKVTSAWPEQQYVEANSGVEITFNTRNVSLEAFKESFSISPAVDGSFTQNGRSFIFYPNKEYKAGTVYTVTLKAGLTSENGQKLQEDYEFQFMTYMSSGEYKNGFHLNDYQAETFLSDEVPLVPIYAYSYAGTEFTVTVYRFDSADSYLAALAESRETVFGDYGCDTTKLGQSFAQYTLKLYQPENASWTSYLILPDTLPVGNYVIDVAAPYFDREGKPTNELCHQQKFIQISDLSVGIQKSGEELFFWLNDAAKDAAAEGAKITLSNGNETVYAKTDKNGVALTSFPLAKGDEISYFNDILTMKIEHASGSYADVLYVSGYANIHEYDYYTYLYTDRAIYHTSDTINLFGIITPRQKAQLPEELYIVMSINDGEMQRHTITPDALGGFTLQLKFEDYLADSNCSISLVDGKGNVYRNQYIAINEYENPVYVVEGEFDKPFYEVGKGTEGVLTVRASFFDGTPAAGLSLNVSIYDRNNIEFDPYVVLDEKGEAKVPFRINNVRSIVGNGNGSIYYHIINAGDNFEESIYSYGSVPVFYRSTIIDIESAAGRDDSMLIHVNKLDTSSVKTASDIWDIENIQGEPLDIPVNLSWAKIYYTKHEDGSFYDFIQKETVTRYKYVRHEDFIDSFTMTAENGVIELTDLNEKLNDENAYYVLSYNYNDVNGYYCYDSRSWGYTYFDYAYNSFYRNFSFMNMNEAADNIFYYSNFTDNENISLQLQENSQPVSSGRYIAVQKGDAFGEYSLNNADVPYLSEFNEDLIPNYVVTGLYFDGKHIYPIDNFNFWYDSSERKLQLEIETDKESYAAGEDITVTVTVKDKDGNAAANTDVLLSLVDEAAFAVEDQYVNILDGIYSQRYRNYVESYASHIQHNLDGDEPGTAEKGGEGGADYIRSDFVDTAFFATLLTDENGKAEFSFSMPDNLTTWRITAQGFNEAMHAGDKVSQTIVTQEFFINPVFSDVYLAGDEAYISLRCFGTSVTGEENVKYSVILTKDGIEQNFAAEGMAGEYTFLKLGRLEAGSYTLTMKAESGELGDAIQKTIECIASGISTNISESFDLAEGINISPEKYPVLLSFSNGSFKEYNEALGWLLSNSNNTRADQALTRAFVLDQLGAADYFGDIDTSWIQPDYTGGLMLFDTDNHSIFFDNQLSALAALAVPEYLNQTTLTDYLYSIVDDYDSAAADIAAAYMGLAALGEPVLLDIRYMLAGDWFEYDEALYLLLGLALLGDEENTESLYETMISARMQIEQNAITGDMAWLSNEKADTYETQFRTAFALAIATAAGKDTDAAMFAEYLQQIKPDRYLYLLQMVYYAKNIEPAESAPAAFSFMQDGERKVIELGMTDKTAFWFSKEQLEKADFKILSGDVYCTAFYEGSAALLDEPARELVKLEKNITTVKGDGGPGTVYLVTVSVKFDKTAPYGGYTVEDYIPSGCRFLKVERYVNDNWYCIDQGLQGITFYYPYPDPAEGLSIYGNSSNGTTTIRYYIRSLLPGDYVSDSAVISHSESGAWGKSAKGMLTIGE